MLFLHFSLLICTKAASSVHTENVSEAQSLDRATTFLVSYFSEQTESKLLFYVKTFKYMH